MSETVKRPLLDVFTDAYGAELPAFDHYGLKATRPDLRTRNGFRWPTSGMRGADLWDADLRSADLWGAEWDETTIWPAGFTPKVNGDA